MLPRFGGLPQLLGVKIAQDVVRVGIFWEFRQKLFEFVRCVDRIICLLEHQREVEPRIMGIGPVEAVPLALKQTGLKLNDIDLIELNEAFASQSLAVIRKLEMNPDIVNVNGGAIALGHPLGCSGAKLSIQLIHELKRRNKKRGIVTACVGGGQGIAGIIEPKSNHLPPLLA